MKNTALQRTVLGILALFLFVYVGFQIWRFFNFPYKTETVNTYTVSESARVTGIALRDEILLEDRVGTGVANYLAADGTKVSTGSTIAEVYRDSADADNVRKLRALEKKRAQLVKSQDPGTTSFAHADVLNKQIFGELGAIIDSVNSKELTGIQGSSDKLLVLMNTKQIATGKQDNYDGAISQVDAEIAYCTERMKEAPTAIISPRPGYFMRTIDGLEGEVDTDNLDELNADQLLTLINTPLRNNTKRVGKLMIDHKWYFAALVPEREMNRYSIGASVTLDFHIGGSTPVPATIVEVNHEKDASNAVVVFRSDYVNDALVNLRVSSADVNFKSVSGLRISSSAIRFEGIQKGVYILRGDKLEFRPVTIVYEDSGFVLCREFTSDPKSPDYANSPHQYDDVVVEGAQLYDDKPI